uniref:Uncharacterized protein n=1 Tax=Panagrolaimus sp. JU765 TaxID=591449 RepID=A0AC34QLX7_9BILA
MAMSTAEKAKLWIDLMPTFDGSTSILEFKNEADKLFSATGITNEEAAKLLPLKLKGKAEAIYNNVKTGGTDMKDFKAVIIKLAEELSKNIIKSSLRQELMEIKKSPNQSIEEVAAKIKLKVERAFPQVKIPGANGEPDQTITEHQEPIMIDAFIEALNPDIQMEINRLIANKGNDVKYKDVIDAAVKAESYLKTNKKRQQKK